jgi:hypothetical protein
MAMALAKQIFGAVKFSRMTDLVKKSFSRMKQGRQAVTDKYMKFTNIRRQTKKAGMDESIANMSIQKTVKEIIAESPVQRANYGIAKTLFGLGKGITVPMVKGMAKPMGWAVRTAVRHPIIAGASIGAMHDVGKHVASTAQERTLHMKHPGMKPNHLSTDGLTLGLSRLRHR